MYTEIIARKSGRTVEVEGVHGNGSRKIMFSGTEKGFSEFLASLKQPQRDMLVVAEYPKVNKRRTLVEVAENFKKDGEVKVRKDLLPRLLKLLQIEDSAVQTTPFGPFYLVRR